MPIFIFKLLAWLTFGLLSKLVEKKIQEKEERKQNKVKK